MPIRLVRICNLVIIPRLSLIILYDIARIVLFGIGHAHFIQRSEPKFCNPVAIHGHNLYIP